MSAATAWVDRLYAWLTRKLSAPNAARHILWLSLALMLPALNTDLAADDYLHQLIVQHKDPITGVERSRLDLFRFCDPQYSPALLREGVFTWWDDPNARLAFFRPVSSLTHYLDYTLWPSLPWLMHLHSLFWGALVLLGVSKLYRELVPDRFIATLAFALYALDDARGWFVSWVAARNAVVATAFSVWALVACLLHRKGKLPSGNLLSALLLGLGLLAGEGSIATLVYLAAYALFLESGSLRQRAQGLWLHALVFVAWRVAYRAADVHVSGSSLYVDPLTDPARFILHVLERGPVLISAQLGGLWSDIWMSLFAFPVIRIAVYVVSVLSILVVGMMYVPYVRRDPLVRYGVFASLLAVLPACAVFPADRLLTWVAIGASLVLATFLAPILKGEGVAAHHGLAAKLAAPVAFGLVLANLIFAPPLIASRSRGNVALRDVLGRADGSVPSDPSIEGKLLLFVNPPAVPLAAYIPFTRAALGIPRADAQRILATSTTDLPVERVDAHTLRFSPPGGFLQDPSAKLMWSEQYEFHVGQRIELEELTITVTQITKDGRPLQIEARLDKPLEDAHHVWRQWVGARYEPWVPPAVGEKVVLPSCDFMQVVFGVKLPVEAKYVVPE